MISSIPVPADGKLKSLHVKAKDYIRFSDNVSSLNVVSSLDDAHIDRSKLKSIHIGSNVKQLQSSCFERCTSLSAVTGGASIQSIDDFAFMDCTSLTSFAPLTPGIAKKLSIKNIGVSAFANTGLREVAVGLSSGSTDSTVQAYAFAGCKQLTSFTNILRNALADHQFDGCTALKNVSLANQHDFCGAYVFQNCTSLEKISMPSNTYFIGEGFCKGCTSLTNFTFEESETSKALLAGANAVGNDFLSGTAVTSLTFPSSITSFAMLSKNALRGMSQLKELHFSGMSINDIVERSEKTTTIKSKYKFNRIYSTIPQKDIMKFGYNNVKDAYPYSSIFIDTSTKQCKSMINYCIQSKIPVVAFSGNSTPAACGMCQNFIKNILSNSKFLSWVQSENNKCIIIDTSDEGNLDIIKSKVGQTGGYGYEAAFGWYDGSKLKMTGINAVSEKEYAKHSGSSSYQSASSFIKKLEALSKDFQMSGSAEVTEVVDADIIETGCFGLNHSVTVFGKDGSVSINIDPSTGSMQFDYETEVHTDTMTKDDFRYSQWYYNAIELRQYADEHHIPVFAEYSSKSCGPCVDFGQSVFNRPEFQSLMSGKNILLCRVEATSDADPEAQYLADTWIQQKPGAVMPLLMAYYNDGQNVYRAYAHYNHLASKTYFTGANAQLQLSSDLAHYWPWLSSYQMVHDWIESYCVNGSKCSVKYVPEQQFMKPAIIEEKKYPRYNYYSTQADDTYGRYFPAVKKTPASSGYSYEISVDNGAGTRTKYIVVVPTPADYPLPPKGTYQCFTTVSSASYDMYYDAYGVMFQIDDDSETALQLSSEWSMSQKTLDDYVSDLTSSSSQLVSSVNYDVYLLDDNGNYTLNIDTTESIYNMHCKYTLDSPKTVDGKQVDVIEAYLCAEPELKRDDPDSLSYIQLTGQPYVLSGMMYSVDKASKSKIVWMSAFTNEQDV